MPFQRAPALWPPEALPSRSVPAKKSGGDRGRRPVHVAELRQGRRGRLPPPDRGYTRFCHILQDQYGLSPPDTDHESARHAPLTLSRNHPQLRASGQETRAPWHITTIADPTSACAAGVGSTIPPIRR